MIEFSSGGVKGLSIRMADGKYVHFSNGLYSTDDAETIAVLKKARGVVSWKEIPSEKKSFVDEVLYTDKPVRRGRRAKGD